MNNITNRVEEILLGKKVYNISLGEGVIESCCVNNEPEIIIEVRFKNKVTKYQLRTTLKTFSLKFDDNVNMSELKTIVNEVDALRLEAEQYRRDQIQKKRTEEKEKAEKEKEAAKIKKLEEQFELTKKKAVINFNIRCQDSEIDNFVAESADYYYNIGWLAANVKTIAARLPDYLDNAFSLHFGEDVPRTTVDTSKRTSGGLKPQWTYAFTASIGKDKNVPNSLRTSLNSSENKIADTDLVWTMVDKHNFAFGKIQNVEKIRETIPANMIEYFEAGFNS